MYTIEVWSDFAELYRYNIFLSAAGYASSGESLYVEGMEKIHREAISSGLKELPIPEGFVEGEKITFEAKAADALLVIVDVVTNTLPADAKVENSPPFDIEIKVRRRGREVHRSTHEVNQWGGANITVKI